MKLNCSDPNPPVQVFIYPGKEDGKTDPFLMLRPANRAALRKIREQTHTKKFKVVNGIVHEYFDVDDDRYELELWKYCMPGWGNLTDEHGNKIEYSPDKAIFLLSNIPFFQGVVNEKLTEVQQIIEDRAKAKEKN